MKINFELMEEYNFSDLSFKDTGENLMYGEEGVDTFVFNKLLKYEKGLHQNATVIEFEERYLHKPNYVAYDFLSSPDLGQVILFMNKVESEVDFKPEKTKGIIIIPEREEILKIIKEIKK